MVKKNIPFLVLLVLTTTLLISILSSHSASAFGPDPCSTAPCNLITNSSDPECQLGGTCVMCPVCAGATHCQEFICQGVNGSSPECQVGRYCAGCPQCATAPAPSTNTPTNVSNNAPGGLFPFVQCGNEGQAPCTLCDLFATANRIITFIRNIVFIIGGLMIVIGGLMMLFGGSSPGLLSSSKKIIKDAIIGLVLVMLSFIIISSILATFAPGAATKFNLKSGGFIINCGP